jgi:hypothetical protein
MYSLRRFHVIRSRQSTAWPIVMSLLRHCRNPASDATTRQPELPIVHGSTLQ